MSRLPLEVADLVRAAGDAFIERSRTWITWKHVKVLLAIARCRTAALGGHLDECTRCGHRAISYNSCRNRHCPKCQAGARDRWLAARRQELLPTRYVHVVFTLPHELVPLALQNKKVIYDLLFRTSAGTARSGEDFLIVAENAIPKRLGGLFETPLRWPTTCTPVSGTLYPSRGRLQPPLGFLCGQQSHFPLVRLRSQQRTEVAYPIAG